jgi:hypothetical protein
MGQADVWRKACLAKVIEVPIVLCFDSAISWVARSRRDRLIGCRRLSHARMASTLAPIVHYLALGKSIAAAVGWVIAAPIRSRTLSFPSP